MDLSARKLFEEVAGYEDAKILGLWEFGTHDKMDRMFCFPRQEENLRILREEVTQGVI